MAQSVKGPTSAQVMILWFVGLSPTSGSVLTAQSLELASDSVFPSLSAPPLLMLCVSLSNIINIFKKRLHHLCPETLSEVYPLHYYFFLSRGSLL